MLVMSAASRRIPYRAEEEAHSVSICSLSSRRFLRRSLMRIPWTTAGSTLLPSRHDRFGHHGHRRRVEIRDPLAQDRNEITHHVRDGFFHAKSVA